MLFWKDAYRKKKAAEQARTANKIKQAGNGAEAKQSSEEDSREFPEWYLPEPGYELRQALQSDKPVYLYIPWITEHTNSLIDNIRADDDYILAPLEFIDDLNKNRRPAFRFARANPDLYRKMIIRRLIPIRSHLAGVIMTFDWAPIMRVISHVCEELAIPRILIPHESVFVDKSKYYWDPRAFASLPLAEVTLGWGSLQKSIFVERGYDPERFLSVGAPKFDKYTNYAPKLNRQQYYRIFGLSPELQTILFASQPLDSQLDTRVARESQRRAISDLLDACEVMGLQLIVRLPPSKDNILGTKLSRRLVLSSYAAIDDALCYLVPPEEAICHSDIVASINSTMLFEGFLMGKLPLTTKYVDFDQLWDPCKFAIAKNLKEIKAHLRRYLDSGFIPDPEGKRWAANMFSNGTFDGHSTSRIRKFLIDAAHSGGIAPQRSSLEKVFNKERIDIVAIPMASSEAQLAYEHLKPLLNANLIMDSSSGMKGLLELASVDLFLQWGNASTSADDRQLEIKSALGRELLLIEDGLLPLPVSYCRTPSKCSIVLDDVSPYYDAYRSTRLERLLNHTVLSDDEIVRARNLIDRIVRERISCHVGAPDVPLTIGRPDAPKILLIDQRCDDPSVSAGMADSMTFRRMLQAAVDNYPHHDIIIKQCPGMARGEGNSFYDNQALAFVKNVHHVHIVDYEINPHSLWDIVEEVHTVTSNLGFDALLRGKKVRCYGMPFYAGWGLTVDDFTLERRSLALNIETIFHTLYVQLSRYFNPRMGAVCELEDYLDLFGTRQDPCSAGGRNEESLLPAEIKY